MASRKYRRDKKGRFAGASGFGPGVNRVASKGLKAVGIKTPQTRAAIHRSELRSARREARKVAA